jgi:hypothetical protein
MTGMDSSTDATDMVKAEQGEMKAVVDESDKSNNDEAKQISAYKTLTELKELRNKQRKF